MIEWYGLFDSVIDLIKDFLFDWLIDFIHCLIYWHIDGLTYSLIDTVIDLFIGELSIMLPSAWIDYLRHSIPKIIVGGIAKLSAI